MPPGASFEPLTAMIVQRADLYRCAGNLKKRKNRHQGGGDNFMHAQTRAIWTVWPQYLRVGLSPGSNQPCKNFWKSTQGFWCWQTPKYGISHWLRWSSLQHSHSHTTVWARDNFGTTSKFLAAYLFCFPAATPCMPLRRVLRCLVRHLQSPAHIARQQRFRSKRQYARDCNASTSDVSSREIERGICPTDTLRLPVAKSLFIITTVTRKPIAGHNK